MKVILDLTKEEIELIIDRFNYDFDNGDSPAFCGWPMSFYQPEDREAIENDEEVKAMLKAGNQLWQYIKER